MDQPIRNLGWRVTLAGMGINLALGVLYSWSVIKKAIPAEWGWSDFDKTLPYSLACLVFSLTMIPAGRAQDRYGPRWVALAGGLTVGLGMILASLTSSVTGFAAGFGLLAGAGFGMGYAAATPAAVKWFPPHRTGLIAGLVVAGFGLASVYIAPAASFLIDHFAGAGHKGPGVQAAMLILGIAFLIIVGVLSQLLAVPPAGFRPAAPSASTAAAPAADCSWQQMLATPQFYSMWLMYAFAAGAGLMIIANLAPIIKLQAGDAAGNHAFLYVALLAIGNAAGRIAAGSASDFIGRRATLFIVFVFQAILMMLLGGVSQAWAFALCSVLLGANYGANLALFPAVTKDYFGLRNFGVNYGWLFTAWGVGGLVLAQVSGSLYDAARAAHRAQLVAGGLAPDLAARQAVGSYNLAYLIAAACLALAAVLAVLVRPPARAPRPQPAPPSAAPTAA